VLEGVFMETWPHYYESDKKLFQIISIALKKTPHLIELIFDPHKPETKIPPAALNAFLDGFSHGEKMLIRIAFDLWSSSGNAVLWEIIETLDSSNFENFLTALTLRRSDVRGSWRHD
jgi:hypothetical protein